MKQSWPLVKLDDLITCNSENVGGDFPYKIINYYDIGAVGSGVCEKPSAIDFSGAPSRAKRLVKEGNTILATVRPGNRSFYYFKSPKENDVVSTGFAVLEANESLIDRKFLYYIVTDCNFTKYLISVEKGANYPAVTPDDIRKAKIKLPPLPIQKKIAGILSAYDDLIENNLKRIKLLEEMAQITYEEWFVRLRFPGHETTPIDSETGLPEGWENLNFGSFLEHEIGGGWGNEEQNKEFSDPAYVIRGTDIGGLVYGNTKKVPYRYHKNSNLKSRKLKDGDIIFEASGGSHNEGVAKTAFINKKLLSLFDNNVMCASFCKLVRPRTIQESIFIFHFLRFLRRSKGTEVFEIRSASNIVNYNWQAFMKYQMVKTPPNNLINDFSEYGKNIRNQIYATAQQNQLLREARDILLPRLMTGMIDVEKYNPAELQKEVA